jgi:predicted nucleic acid-binding protein
VIFDEDRCRSRKDNSLLNLAIIRHAAFDILKSDNTLGSLRRKRLRACIDPKFRTQLFVD